MSTTVYESIILDVPAAATWDTVSGLDFGYLPTVARVVLENKAHPADVGGIRTVTYKDGTVQKIKLTERSDARTELSWDLIESTPSISSMSVSWTLKLTEVKLPSGNVFAEWTADFSRDASNEVLADAKYKAKEHFVFIRQATKARLIAEANKGAVVPTLKRQLSQKSAMLHAAFQRLDTNKNGKLEFEEFSVVVNKLFGHNLPESALRIILMDADLNSDNTIDFDEFCKFLGKHTTDDPASPSSAAAASPSAAATAAAAAPAKK